MNTFKNIRLQGYFKSKELDEVSVYYIYDSVSKDEIYRHAINCPHAEGRLFANYYFSRNSNIPSFELENSKNLIEAKNILNEYSYNIRYAFVKDTLGIIKFVDCFEEPNNDICSPK